MRWIGYGTAGALAVGAVVFGVVTAGKASTLSDDKNTYGVSRSELDDAQSSARLFAGITAGLAVGAIAVATVTFVTSRPRATSDTPHTALVFTGNGARLEGTF